MSEGLVLQKGLPVSLDAEAFVLGSALLDSDRFTEIAAAITDGDFATEAHKRIFRRMASLHERGEKIDYVTVATELQRFGELESVDGITGITSLTTGIPALANIDGWIKIVKDKATLRRIAVAAQHLMNRALTAEDSPDDILACAEESLLGISQTRLTGEDEGLLSTEEFLTNFKGGWNAFAQPHTRQNGLSTGLKRFDEMTGGLRGGELGIMAARPGVGKSAAAIGIAWHVACKYDQPVAFFSLEMSRESLLTRVLCGAARIDSQRLRAGYLNDGERQKIHIARNRMLDAPLYIDDTSNLGLMELHAKCRRWEQLNKKKIALVVVDYLQLMASRGKVENENAQITKITRGLKLMSKEMNCPFLVLSQLSRASEQRTGDKRPQLSDLRSSGSIEQDSDWVALLYRESLHKPDREDLRGLAELIVAKQRSGPLGTVRLVFLENMTRFENQAEDVGDLPPEDIGTFSYADR